MNRYMDRCIDRLIERDLGIFGAVLIQGPKWCGKITTAQRFAESLLSLSDPAGDFAALQLARLDPAQALSAQRRDSSTNGRKSRNYGTQYVSSATAEQVNLGSFCLRDQRRRTMPTVRCTAASDVYPACAWKR